MITVIDNYNESAFNCYEGMSLGEAVNSMVLESHNVINELMMDILLTEHSYLYENATEITYVNEDGKENANGISLKEKIANAIDKVRTFISSAWNNFASWVQDKVEDIVTNIKKIGVNKQKYDEAVKKILAGGNVAIKVDKWALSSDVNGAITGLEGFHNNIADGNHLYEPGEYFDGYAVKADEGDYIKLKKEELEHAGYVVFDMKGVIRQIRKNQSDMDKALSNIKKQALTLKEDDRGEVLKKVSNTIKSNANVAKDKIKLYNKNIAANLTIVRDVIKSAKSVKPAELSDKEKEAKKAESEAKLTADAEKAAAEKKQADEEKMRRRSAIQNYKKYMANGKMSKKQARAMALRNAKVTEESAIINNYDSIFEAVDIAMGYNNTIAKYFAE